MDEGEPDMKEIPRENHVGVQMRAAVARAVASDTIALPSGMQLPCYNGLAGQSVIEGDSSIIAASFVAAARTALIADLEGTLASRGDLVTEATGSVHQRQPQGYSHPMQHPSVGNTPNNTPSAAVSLNQAVASQVGPGELYALSRDGCWVKASDLYSVSIGTKHLRMTPLASPSAGYSKSTTRRLSEITVRRVGSYTLEITQVDGCTKLRRPLALAFQVNVTSLYEALVLAGAAAGEAAEYDAGTEETKEVMVVEEQLSQPESGDEDASGSRLADDQPADLSSPPLPSQEPVGQLERGRNGGRGRSTRKGSLVRLSMSQFPTAVQKHLLRLKQQEESPNAEEEAVDDNSTGGEKGVVADYSAYLAEVERLCSIVNGSEEELQAVEGRSSLPRSISINWPEGAAEQGVTAQSELEKAVLRQELLEKERAARVERDRNWAEEQVARERDMLEQELESVKKREEERKLEAAAHRDTIANLLADLEALRLRVVKVEQEDLKRLRREEAAASERELQEEKRSDEVVKRDGSEQLKANKQDQGSKSPKSKNSKNQHKSPKSSKFSLPNLLKTRRRTSKASARQPTVTAPQVSHASELAFPDMSMRDPMLSVSPHSRRAA
ncbi:unnamed protein product [Chrysoparadoxa australica]